MSWAVIYLAGFCLGGRFPATQPAASIRSQTVARTSAVLPVIFYMGSGSVVIPIWLGVFAGGWAAGSLEAGNRGARVIAEAEGPGALAVPLVWSGPALMRLTGWPSPSSGERWKAPARLLEFLPNQVPSGRSAPHVGQGVMIAGKGDPPEFGSVVAGHLDLSPPPGAPLRGSFDYRLFLSGRGILWKGKLGDWQTLQSSDLVSLLGTKVFTPLRTGLVSRLGKNLPEIEATMARAVLLGIRDQDSRQASRPFADLGLAHLFAVSGLHVGVLLGIFLLPARWGGFSPWWRVSPFMILLPAYVLITGMPGSVVRAASLGFLTLFASALGKPSQPLRLIGFLLWAGTVWDPCQNLDIGLKLSYLAAGGILAVSYLTNGLKLSPHKVLGPIFTGLAVCGAAQWFTLPVIAAAFGRINLLSPLANLLAVPLFGLAVWCVVLSLVTVDLWPPGAESFAALGWLLFRFLAGVAGTLSRSTAMFSLGLPVPGLWALFVWAGLTAVGLGLLNRHGAGKMGSRKTLFLVLSAIGCGLLVFGPLAWKLRSPQKLSAWQFDVGQGDCSLLVFPDGWSAMIDTGGRFGFSGPGVDGPFQRTVLPFLQRNGMRKIDAVVLTHGHLDHTGGAAALAEALGVNRWYVSGRAGLSLAAEVDTALMVHPESGHLLHRWKDWTLVIVYPSKDLPETLHENDRSQVVVLRLGRRDMAVWSGDLELAGERLMLELERAPVDIQVWKAGHHGSDTSGSPPLLARFDPALIMISCGVGNTYGHPSHGPYVVHGDTVAIARTDLQGSILLEWEPGGRLQWQTGTAGRQTVGHP